MIEFTKQTACLSYLVLFEVQKKIAGLGVLQRSSQGRKGMANLRDIAHKAGCSTATVSRVINNNPKVSADIRARVHAAMDELNYLPSKGETTISGKKSGLIGCIVPNLTNPHFSQLVMTLEQEAAYAGLELLIKTHLNNSEREAAAIQAFIKLGVQGLLWVPTVDEAKQVPLIKRAGIDAVALTLRSKFLNSVLVDYRAGMRLIAQHCAEQGLTLLGVVCQEDSDSEKVWALKEYCRLANVNVPPSLCFSVPKGICEDVTSSAQLLTQTVSAIGTKLMVLQKQPQKPNKLSLEQIERREQLTGAAPTAGFQPSARIALWVYNDIFAVRLLRELSERGLKDVAVLGYDNTYLSYLMGITSVTQPIAEMARRAFSLLRDPFKGAAIECVELEPELIARASTLGHSGPK